MIQYRILAFFLLIINITHAQINPQDVTIIRDSYGIPHIYGKTDAAMTYGLVWAACEDDFKTLQEALLATRGELAKVKGKEGAILDVLAHVLDVRTQAEIRTQNTTLSPSYQEVVNAYMQAINTYAEQHPDEILIKGTFPIDIVDFAATQMMGVAMISNVQFDVLRLVNGSIFDFEAPQTMGSNAFAVNGNYSEEGSTMICLNSHQPIQGMYAWYEAHIVSEESGINMYGATFVGGTSLFIGVNEHLSWSHTVNLADHADVYKLKMHPKKKHYYELDGQWEKLEPYPIPLKVKLWGPIKLPIKKKFYRSKHGVVVKNKHGYYALRHRANMGFRGGEQWMAMCQSKNLEEFKEALAIRTVPALNVVYADKEGHLFFRSNGNFPIRDKRYNWRKVLPGNESDLIWGDSMHAISDLVTVEDPAAGYIYNTNNPPFNCTSEAHSLDPKDYNPTFGYITEENNRGIRLRYLMEKLGPISYEDMKTIKDDNYFHIPTYTGNLQNIDLLFNLDENDYPKLAESIRLLKTWDRKCDPDRKAAIASITIYYILEEVFEKGYMPGSFVLDERMIVQNLKKGQKHLKRHFGRLDVTLGELQRLERGDTTYPVGGMPDVLAAMTFLKGKKGRLYGYIGDAFYQYARWDKNGELFMEAINIFGQSNKPDSPHFDDQVDMFLKQELRRVYLDKAKIMQDVEREYHPGD